MPFLMILPKASRVTFKHCKSDHVTHQMASAALTIKFVLMGPTIKAHMAWPLPASLTSLGPVSPTLLFSSQDDLRVSFHTGQAHCLQPLLPTLKKIIIMKYFKHSEIKRIMQLTTLYPPARANKNYFQPYLSSTSLPSCFKKLPRCS